MTASCSCPAVRDLFPVVVELARLVLLVAGGAAPFAAVPSVVTLVTSAVFVVFLGAAFLGVLFFGAAFREVFVSWASGPGSVGPSPLATVVGSDVVSTVNFSSAAGGTD